jgi:shikimate 5-dehydrogenase
MRVLAGAGARMLAGQGAAALARWTGREAPIDVMRAALGL